MIGLSDAMLTMVARPVHRQGSESTRQDESGGFDAGG